MIVPWTAYRRFGDDGLLRRQYPSMRAWVDGLTAALGPGTLFDQPARQLGDWLDPAAPPDTPWAATTDPHLVATAYRAHVAALLARVAAVLGEEADAAKYAELADGVRQAFGDEYVSPPSSTSAWRMVSDPQTAYALALEFGLLPDGSVNPGAMTSFNHYAFGAVAHWMHRVIGGLAPAAPGYRELRVEPRPGGGLTWARTAHLTPYGLAEVSWRRERETLTVDVTVPAGTTATVVLPGSAPVPAGPGRHQFSSACRDAAEEE